MLVRLRLLVLAAVISACIVAEGPAHLPAMPS